MNFADRNSIYQKKLEDDKVLVVPVEKGERTDTGCIDITEILQQSLYQLKSELTLGIVMLPEGEYQIHDTIYIPRSVRLYGYGRKRPVIRLAPDAEGFGGNGEPAIENVRYMFWFTSNMPTGKEDVIDANPGTFYSALANIDFEIGKGNHSAAVIRSHFAQNCYVSYCHFEIGDGLAGIHDVGNEMEHLSFCGGEWGIYTGRCSPGWPFVLTDSEFFGQRKAGIYCKQSGMTVFRTHFSNAPAAMESMEGAWDKIVMKDCLLENLECGLKIAEEENICTQVNARNVYGSRVPVFALLKKSQKSCAADAETYLVESFTHGLVKKFEEPEPEYVTELKAVQKSLEEIRKGCCWQKEPGLPDQETWVNVKRYGAAGDGTTDDTEAIRRAVAEQEVLYFPQGNYRVTDTIILKENTKLIGAHPYATMICLQDNEDNFAGIGAPKAMVETPQGGENRIQSIGINTAGRNPKAVGVKWQSGVSSYMYDVKFVGGHGSMKTGKEFTPTYNRSRTRDFNEDYDWDSQYWSLWVTNQGGGVFKNLWTASPYAAAGVYISKTSNKGIMYQVSSEHHVRQEIVLNEVENWELYGMQTEEEVAESSYCQPFELSGCKNIVFGNLYAFRVILVDNPYDAVMRTWDCEKLEVMNFHNFTQMKYTTQNAVRDMNSGCTEGEWQMARFRMEGSSRKKELTKELWEPQLLMSHLDAVDSLSSDGKGNVYVCDSRLKRIYVWNRERGTMRLLLTLQHRPLTVAVDTEGNLLMVMEYRPVKYAKINGVEELKIQEPWENRKRDYDDFHYRYFRFDRRIRVLTMKPEEGEESLRLLEPVAKKGQKLKQLYYPVNQWQDNEDVKKIVAVPEESCYVAPDGVTGIANASTLTRTAMLVTVRPKENFYAVDEYSKRVLKLEADEELDLHDPVEAAYRGEYSALASQSGELFVTDNVIHRYHDETVDRIRLEERPACLCWLDEEQTYLLVTARTKFYVIRVK